MDPALIAALSQIGQAVGGLTLTGFLLYLFVSWMQGKIHADAEVKRLAEEQATALAYRETLRQEAVADRHASDERITQLVKQNEERDELMRRSLDLTESLLEDLRANAAKPNPRTKRPTS